MTKPAYLLGIVLGGMMLASTEAAEPQPAAAEPQPAMASLIDPRPVVALADLEAMAIEHNPTLVQAAMRVRAAEGGCIQAGLRPNPRAGYVATEMGDEGKAGQQGGFVAQEFVTGGKLQFAQGAAAAAVQEAQQACRAQQQRVLNDVRIGYYEVLIAKRTVEMEQKLAEIGDQSLGTAEKLMQAKEVSRVDVLQARVEADTARLRLANAQSRLQGSWQRLAATLGMPGMPLPRLNGDSERGWPELTWPQAVERLLATSPELAEARAGVGRARCELARQCAEPKPNVDVMASVQYDNATQDTIAGLQVGIPVPIFNRNQGNITRARAELVQAENEVRRVELRLQQQLASAFEHYSISRQQVEKYRSQILPNAQASLDLVTAGYRQGEFPYQTMLIAQRTYFQSVVSYLESLRELWTRSVEIEGQLLSGGLGEVSGGAARSGSEGRN